VKQFYLDCVNSIKFTVSDIRIFGQNKKTNFTKKFVAIWVNPDIRGTKMVYRFVLLIISTNAL